MSDRLSRGLRYSSHEPTPVGGRRRVPHQRVAAPPGRGRGWSCLGCARLMIGRPGRLDPVARLATPRTDDDEVVSGPSRLSSESTKTPAWKAWDGSPAGPGGVDFSEIRRSRWGVWGVSTGRFQRARQGGFGVSIFLIETSSKGRFRSHKRVMQSVDGVKSRGSTWAIGGDPDGAFSGTSRASWEARSGVLRASLTISPRGVAFRPNAHRPSDPLALPSLALPSLALRSPAQVERTTRPTTSR